MSSLMQFTGQIDSRKGVRLEAYLTSDKEHYRAGAGASEYYRDNPPSIPQLGKPLETFQCTQCSRTHEFLWVFWRQPRGMFGPWVIFEFNGEKQVPDLSIPMALWKMPRDAVKLSQEESEAAWHSG